MANFQKWVLAVAIAIMLNLFINYGVNLFYPGPDYNQFCPSQAVPSIPTKPILPNNISCPDISAGPEIQANCTLQKGYVNYRYNSNGCATEAYCETCQNSFNHVEQSRNSNIFIILIIAGIIAVIAGLGVKAEAVSIGLLLGGVVSLIIAAIRWGQLQNTIKLGILGAVLIILIWLGYKKVK